MSKVKEFFDFLNLLEDEVDKEDPEMIIGLEVEAEHKDLFDIIKNHCESNKIDMPFSWEEFKRIIASVHVKENKEYYSLLKKYVEN